MHWGSNLLFQCAFCGYAVVNLFSIQLPSTTHSVEDSQWDGDVEVGGQQEEEEEDE